MKCSVSTASAVCLCGSVCLYNPVVNLVVVARHRVEDGILSGSNASNEAVMMTENSTH